MIDSRYNSLLTTDSDISSTECYIKGKEVIPFITSWNSISLRNDMITNALQEKGKVIVSMPASEKPIIAVGANVEVIYTVRELTNFLKVNRLAEGKCYLSGMPEGNKDFISGFLANAAINIEIQNSLKTTVPCIQVNKRIVIASRQYQMLDKKQMSLFYKFVIRNKYRPLVLHNENIRDELALEYGYLISR